MASLPCAALNGHEDCIDKLLHPSHKLLKKSSPELNFPPPL